MTKPAEPSDAELIAEAGAKRLDFVHVDFAKELAVRLEKRNAERDELNERLKDEHGQHIQGHKIAYEQINGLLRLLSEADRWQPWHEVACVAYGIDGSMRSKECTCGLSKWLSEIDDARFSV